MLTLYWHNDGNTQTFHTDRTEMVRLGRSDEVDVFFTDLRVSRNHAELFWRGGKWHIRNLSQTNLVKVGRQQLEYKEEMAVYDGVTLQLGQTEVMVKTSVSDESAPVIRCFRCHNTVEYKPADYCPFCGYALSSAETRWVGSSRKKG